MYHRNIFFLCGGGGMQGVRGGLGCCVGGKRNA